MSENFDVVIIGGGPGGYSSAIRCAQYGASVALIEKESLGGVCLNCGCIPSKALLSSVHVLKMAKNASGMGVDILSVSANWMNMQKRKDSIVKEFRIGLEGLVQSHKVKIFQGKGIVTEPGKVKVEMNAGITELNTTSIILATGAKPIEFDAFPFDGKWILNSTDALNLKEIPESMAIIGGGVIGCELACVYANVGSKITIIEALDRILNHEDKWVGRMLESELRNLGIKVLTGGHVTSIDTFEGRAKIGLKNGDIIKAEKVLVTVGREPSCDKETVSGMGLEMRGMKIAVNEKMETNVPGVYAVGDVVGTTFLAHGAFAEAEVAAKNVTGGYATMGDYSLIPRVVYTFPEVASVGKTEGECKKVGIDIEVGKAVFRANVRSVAYNETSGEIRVVREKKSDRILGVTMVGVTVSELVPSARALIGSTKKLSEMSFAHPTISEVLKEAWEDSFGLRLHAPPKVME